MIKLVAFDWNGTILADTNAVVASDNAVLKHFGFRKTNLQKVQAAFQMPIRNFWTNLGLNGRFFDQHANEIIEVFYKNYEPLEQLCRTRSGAKEILQFLQREGIRTVIFSNHIIPHIQKQLIRLKINKFVDNVLAREIGDNTHTHQKSKNQKLKSFVKSLKLKTKEVLVVGDTEEEIEIAKEFGYYSVGLTGGNISTAKLKATKPDFLIHNLRELKAIINKLNLN
ncbi:MAG: HAD family hydrolase [Candidatus Doudnabacteria bacterium]|nr:HAD family hydrolase [Candidatus Doudnabacteria bacterium]